MEACHRWTFFLDSLHVRLSLSLSIGLFHEADADRWNRFFSHSFIRSIYRTIELSNGWTSHLARHQPTFNFLDGFMILVSSTALEFHTFDFAHPFFFYVSIQLAMLAINFLHPGQLLDTRRNVVELGMRKKKNQLAPNATDAIGSDSQRSGKV
jgi:hypothetical protein